MIPATHALRFETVFGAMTFTAGPIRNLDAPRYYRVRWYQRGYTGTVTKLIAGGTPVVLEQAGDDPFGIKPTKITVEVIAQSTVSLQDFYPADDRALFCLLEQVDYDENGIRVVFAGWVTAFDSSEPFQAAPYPIQVPATCGLGSLADFVLADADTQKPLHGRYPLNVLIGHCLRASGLTLALNVSCHLAEDSQMIITPGTGQLPLRTTHPGTWFVPFNGVFVDVSRWQDEKGQFSDCKTVLADLLTGFGARLYQHGGEWFWVCLTEIDPTQATLNLLRYDPEEAQPTQVSINTGLTLSRGGDIRAMDGTTLATESAQLRNKLTFDYGPARSILENGNLAGTIGQRPMSFYAGPDVDDNPGSGTTVGTGTLDNPYGLFWGPDNVGMGYGAVGPAQAGNPNRINPYLYVYTRTTVEGQPGYNFSPAVKLVGTYINKFCKGARYKLICWQVEDPSQPDVWTPGLGINFIDSTGKWADYQSGNLVSPGGVASTRLLQNEPSAITVDNLLEDGVHNGSSAYFAKPTTGETFNVTTDPLPVDRGRQNKAIVLTGKQLAYWRVEIRLYPGETFNYRTGNVRTDYSLIYRFISLSLVDKSRVELIGEVITIETGTQIPGLVRKKTTDIPLTVGDQTTTSATVSIPIRSGALTRADGSPTRKWHTVAGETGRLINLIGNGRLRLTAKPRTIIDGGVVGEPALHSLITSNGAGGTFLMSSLKWSLRTRQTSIRAVALPAHGENVAIKTTGSFQAEGGALLPMVDTDAAGTTDEGMITIPAAAPQSGNGSVAGLENLFNRFKNRIPPGGTPRFIDVPDVPENIPRGQGGGRVIIIND